ncbi:hypothetical protein RIF29_15187 [Crotalaria pallida]|uniref:Uncharacterized protein n=1 Tax=Crotalaria pallida TaxID=3830 RepID=A0AAN9FLC5_CROPI
MITASPDNPKPTVLHSPSTILETQESRAANQDSDLVADRVCPLLMMVTLSRCFSFPIDESSLFPIEQKLKHKTK